MNRLLAVLCLLVAVTAQAESRRFAVIADTQTPELWRFEVRPSDSQRIQTR